MALDHRTGITIDPAWIGPPSGRSVQNPTLWLFIACATLYGVAIGFYLSDRISYWIFLALSSIALYLAYTVLHEGVHGCLHRRRVISGAISRICGFLLIFSFPMFREIHLAHHREPNTPHDPDAIAGKFGVVGAVFGGLLVFCNYYRLYYTRIARFNGALAESLITHLLQIAIILIAIMNDWFIDLFQIAIAPLMVTLWFLVFFFDYLPHHPHHAGDARCATRTYGGRFLNVLLLGQNFHLIHHLWPRIPWFRYGRAYEKTAQSLKAREFRVG